MAGLGVIVKTYVLIVFVHLPHRFFIANRFSGSYRASEFGRSRVTREEWHSKRISKWKEKKQLTVAKISWVVGAQEVIAILGNFNEPAGNALTSGGLCERRLRVTRTIGSVITWRGEFYSKSTKLKRGLDRRAWYMLIWRVHPDVPAGPPLLYNCQLLPHLAFLISR